MMKTDDVIGKQFVAIVKELESRMADPRSAQGKRYPFLLMLLLCVGAIAGGSNTIEAIARFAISDLANSLVRRVYDGTSLPSRTTLRNFLERMGPNDFLRETNYVLEHLFPKSKVKGIAVDGKALNAAHGEEERAPILVSAVLHGIGATIAQEKVDLKSNEISVFKKLFGSTDIAGHIVTADAIQTQRANAEFIVDVKSADYLFPVKENQPSLLRAIEDESITSGKHASVSLEKGHGRVEERALWISEAPANIKESFPHAEQICAIERTRVVLGNKEKITKDVTYYITSLAKEKVAPSTILALIRGHWTVESKVHHCLDVAFDEDRCRARKGNLPFVISALKKVVMTIFRANGIQNITAARQKFALNR